MRMAWKYFPGDLVQLASGEVCKIAARREILEEGETVPIYVAVQVRDGKVHGSVRLIRDAGIVGEARGPAEAPFVRNGSWSWPSPT
jgi:hypothetical protein